MRTLITVLSIFFFSTSVYVTVLALRLGTPGKEAPPGGTPVHLRPSLPSAPDAGGASVRSGGGTPDAAAELERAVRDLREEMDRKEEDSERLSREREAGQAIVADLRESIEGLQEKLAARDSEAIAQIAREQEARRAELTELQETITGLREELEALREKVPPPPAPALGEASRRSLHTPAEEGAAGPGEEGAAGPGEETAPSGGIDGGRVIAILGGGFFRSGQDGLSDEIERALERTLPEIVSHPGHRIVVEGHSDNVPVGRGEEKDFSDNRTLSRLRAEKVAGFLESQGVEAGRITVIGYGDTRPLAPNRTAEGRAENRRVEIRLLRPERGGAEE